MLVDVKSIVVPLNSLHLQIKQINCSTPDFVDVKKLLYFICGLCLVYATALERKNAKNAPMSVKFLSWRISLQSTFRNGARSINYVELLVYCSK
jgi:hypothetical protein